jgi:type IV pilus assembly protein PilO
MADLNRVRTQLTFVGFVLCGVCLLAGLYLLAPIGDSENALQKQWEEAKKSKLEKEKDVAPLRGMDKKLEKAQLDMRTFKATRLPVLYSEIAVKLGDIAQSNDVQLSGASYTQPEMDAGPDLQPVVVSVGLTGEYKNVITFLNAVEKSRQFYLVDSIGVGGEQSGATTKLTVHILTFLRVGNAALLSADKINSNDATPSGKTKPMSTDDKKQKTSTDSTKKNLSNSE